MKFKLTLPFLTSVFLCGMVASQTSADWADPDKYPIDKETKKSIEKNPSTGGESACWDLAYRKWDAELDIQLKKLSRMLKPEEQKRLQVDQLQWLKYKDAELKVIDDVYSHTSGSMFAPMNAASRVRIVRERVILLKHYQELVHGL